MHGAVQTTYLHLGISWAWFGDQLRRSLIRVTIVSDVFERGQSHDQFGNLFAALDAEAFQGCFIAWVASLNKLGPEIVAIDGKTLRRSCQEGGAKAPIHMISAFSGSQRMVLSQRKVADKSNEINAIPELLELLTVKGAIVTIDAKGCQKDIAAKIIEKGADYLLALKGNQGSLRDDVELFFTDQNERGFADAAMSRHQTFGEEPWTHRNALIFCN